MCGLRVGNARDEKCGDGRGGRRDRVDQSEREGVLSDRGFAKRGNKTDEHEREHRRQLPIVGVLVRAWQEGNEATDDEAED